MKPTQTLTASLWAIVALAGATVAHPGEEQSREKLEKLRVHRDLADLHAREVTAKCLNTKAHQQLQERAAERRSLVAQRLRKERGIEDSESISGAIGGLERRFN
jgi:hypothetical protein